MKNDKILEEYDFSNGIRGKYAQEYNDSIKLNSDIIKFFPDTKSVNKALKTLINLVKIRIK